jgi:hypothetical protein
MPNKADAQPADEQSLTLEAVATVEKRRPVPTKEGQALEITLIIANPEPEDLNLLWSAIGFECRATLTFAGRQVRLS